MAVKFGGVRPADNIDNTTDVRHAMSYRSLLVHVDDNESSVRGVAAAAALAGAFGAELVGAYLVPTRELTPFGSAMLPDTLVAQILRATGDAQAAAEELFRDAAARAGLAAIEWRAPAGDAVAAGIRQARYSDLVIVGQPEPGHATAGFVAELAHSILLASGRPVLFVPYIGARTTLGERIVVAWKDTREAARAVADALPLLVRAKSVEVLSILPSDQADEPGGDRIITYLARHGVIAKRRSEVAEDLSAGELLLSQVSDLSADLIVMGGYSHSRLQERVMGGVTRVMMTSMTVPVLMSH
jgi:nucleotide-binding universal stress UspA family protein